MAEQQTCQCCGAAMLSKSANGSYALFTCPACGADYFVSESDSVSSDLYENDDDYLDDLAVGDRSSDFVMWHHRKALSFLARKYRHPETVRTLDIGCFNGFLVKELRDRGFQAFGIDFNRLAIEKGQRDFSLRDAISCRTLSELGERDELFDAISAFEVIEHLEEPSAFLNDAVKLLKPGGYLILSTPNKNMVARPALDWPPHHLSRFTIGSLRAIMQQTGIEPVYAAEQMSSFDLVRHRIGMAFRKPDKASLRGGGFRNKAFANHLRRIANRISRGASIALTPVNIVLHAAGMRYISQVAIGRKIG
jgi:SAM-dependent methyltransferase